MTRDQSFHGLRKLGATLAAAALLVTACTTDGGGGTAGAGSPAPAGSPGGGGSASPAGGGGGGTTDYPTSEITCVVPFSAGGPTDTVTRLIAEPMSTILGQSVVVQNVEGAGGTVAAGEVANAAADGYTVLMHHIGMSTAPTLYSDLEYDPLTDFKPIGLVTEVPMTIIGKKDLQPTTLQELVDYVKANGEAVTYAHAGIGAASHLCGLLFQSAVGAKVTEVPYEGTAPALTDIVGGQVDFLCDQTTNTTGQIQGGEVKAYAVTTQQRVETLGDIPTTAEAGLPDVGVTVWHGLYVPADTPDEVVQILSDALKEALTDQNVIDELGKLGAAPVAEDQATPDAHRQKLESEIELWRPIIEAAGVQAP